VVALKHPDEKMRRGAELALNEMGPMVVDALPNLAGALWDEEEMVYAFATRALGRIGPQALEALPFLMFRFMAASY